MILLREITSHVLDVFFILRIKIISSDMFYPETENTAKGSHIQSKHPPRI